MSITEALQRCSLVWLVSGFTFRSQECTWGCEKSYAHAYGEAEAQKRGI